MNLTKDQRDKIRLAQEHRRKREEQSKRLVEGNLDVNILSGEGVGEIAQAIVSLTECVRELAPIVAAIRYAENGGKGKEYGILHPRVKPTYRSQAGWCAATVQKNYDRWVKAGRKGDYVTFLGKRYCPIGADNDPNGLNKHWIPNVKKFQKRFAN